MISEKQKQLLAFGYTGYDALIAYGAVRSGKTSLMVVAFVDWAMREFDGCKLGICGKTVGSAIENVIRPFLAMKRTHERYRIRWNRSEKLLTVSRGKVCNVFEVFGGKDEASQDLIQGRTLAGVLMDEVALMPRSFVNQATARCSVDGSKFWFNCNPDNPRHWFYIEWILKAREKNALVLHFRLDDNPSLSEHIRKRYESQYHGVFRRRYIDGDWVVAEGLVYQYDESEVSCTHEEAAGLREMPSGEMVDGKGAWYVSIDYGIVNPFAALLWRVTPDCAYVVDEYYFDSREEGRRLTDAEHLDNVERLVGSRKIEGVVIDPSASSFKEEIWRRGRLMVTDADNEVVEGIRVTDQMLSKGAIKVAQGCSGTLSEMGMYRWDDKAAKDSVVKEFDHAMDAMRYMANTVMKYYLKGFVS